jgi:hypothetical protein
VSVKVALPAALLLLLGLAVPGFASGEAPQQEVTPVTPSVEQHVEPIGSGGEQHVDAIDATGSQSQQVIATGTKGPVRRMADGVAKAVLVTLGATVAVGTTVIGLLFL